VLIGDAAMRDLLLSELERCDWRLTDTAEALDIGSPSNVKHFIQQLGLLPEYEAARIAGKVKPGPRSRR
jgi:hypothetical protein